MFYLSALSLHSMVMRQLIFTPQTASRADEKQQRRRLRRLRPIRAPLTGPLAQRWAGGRDGQCASFAQRGRDHLHATAFTGILHKTSVIVMPTSPSPHLNLATGASAAGAPPPGLRLLDQVCKQVRYLHHSIGTEQAHVNGRGPMSGSWGCGTHGSWG